MPSVGSTTCPARTSCSPTGAFLNWREREARASVANVCLLRQSGKDLLSTSLSHFDPQRTFSRCLLSSGNVSSCQQNLVVSQFQDWRVRHMGKLAVVATIKTVAGQAR